MIDDCSTDKSYDYLKQNSSNVNIVVIKNEKNRGYGYSNKGVKIAKNNVIAISDCDGTYPIREILKMFEIFNLNKNTT